MWEGKGVYRVLVDKPEEKSDSSTVVDSNYLITHSLTPHSTVLEKLTGLQLVKKFSAFYGTRRFFIVLTSARHLSLS
jgi:hypothetical protein